MNPNERDVLQRFLAQLSEARVAERDAEADALIREAVARQPDAAYLLVQRALLVEQALNAAKSRLAEAQNQRNGPNAQGSGGFLSGRNPWEPASPKPVPGAAAYQMPSSAAHGFGTVPAAPGGSFLSSVASTAAGVVAGSFLFHGIENLLGHAHGADGSWMSGASEHPAEQTVINNYYDDLPDERDFDQLSENEDYEPDIGDGDSGFPDDSDDSGWA